METLRERKKQRTREALLRVAIELFTTRGYEGTTVDDIADAVGVSQRTFFRYFAGKEDAALALDEMTVARFVDAVSGRATRPRCAPCTRSSTRWYRWSGSSPCTG